MGMFQKISRMLSGFFDYVDKHQHGILVTVIFHLLIITGLLIVKIRSSQITEVAVVFDFTQQISEEERYLEEMEGLEENQEEQGFMERAYAAATSNLRNLPVNQADINLRAEENIGKMVDEIKKELNVTDEMAGDEPDPFDASPLSPNELSIGTGRPEQPVSGEGALYRGPTSLSYELKDRTHVSMPIPVYMCKGSGVVSVSIVVSPRGAVTSASVISANTSDGSDCFTEAALAAARSSRFNPDPEAEERQRGSITYTFQPQ